jgi:hypothetical protein
MSVELNDVVSDDDWACIDQCVGAGITFVVMAVYIILLV